MTSSSKKNRVVFLDLIRAFAVIMMVQGHTIDVLLRDSYRDLTSPVYSVWWFNRGMTAPIFLFTAGTVFNYLFKLRNEPFWQNPRVWKGIKRFVLLMILGYVLKYPTREIFNFSNISDDRWQIFFNVDVLQLIGCGIMAIMFLNLIAEWTKLKDIWIFGIGALACIVLFPPTNNMYFEDYMPRYLATYFSSTIHYHNGAPGSNFPLIPWLCYMFCGAILGSFLAKNPAIFKTTSFSKKLALAGLGFVVASLIGDVIEVLLIGKSNYWTISPNLILVRIGYVLLLNSLFAYLARKMVTIPKLIILLGRNTLLIYVVHLLILYGSPWFLGVEHYWMRRFDVYTTVFLALEMIGVMTLMVVVLNKLNMRNKPL
jgi:uncharacterized membrane protein